MTSIDSDSSPRTNGSGHPTERRATGLASVLAALPWCCLLPAAMALAGVAGAGAARLAARELAPLLAAATLLLLGRAHVAVTVRRHGAAWSRWMVWISTLLAAALWAPRLL